MHGKYVIFESARYGIEYPVLFPEHFVTHDQIKVSCDKPVRAGKFSIGVNGTGSSFKVTTYGNSISLRLESHEDDGLLIYEQLTR